MRRTAREKAKGKEGTHFERKTRGRDKGIEADAERCATLGCRNMSAVLHLPPQSLATAPSDLTLLDESTACGTRCLALTLAHSDLAGSPMVLYSLAVLLSSRLPPHFPSRRAADTRVPSASLQAERSLRVSPRPPTLRYACPCAVLD